MKKFIVRFWIILLTFTIGISVTLIWLKYKPVKESLEEVNISETSTEKYNISEVLNVEYCEIINNPQKYDGKVIQLKDVKLVVGSTHGYSLISDKCLDKDNNPVMAIVFEKSKQELLLSGINQLSRKSRLLIPIEITAVGRFIIRKKLYIDEVSDAVQDRTDLHFELWDFENAKR